MDASVVSMALCLLTVIAMGERGDAAETVPPLPVYDLVAGQQTVHAVTNGETLVQIAHTFGIPVHLLAVTNHLADVNRLHIGQRLVVSNRHIVPSTRRDGIVINVGDRILYWLRDGKVVAAFPVGVGRAAWETPPGHYTIVGRRNDPVWHVPPSIQREMKARGEEVKKKVLPGPDNPLGKYWLQLSVPGYGIHGTNAPGSVGKYTTHGCIRLRADDVERLYKEIATGTAVDVVNEPIKVARLDGDHILLEAHAGITGLSKEAVGATSDRLQAAGLADLVNLDAAQRVLRDAWGIAVDISKRPPASPTAHD